MNQARQYSQKPEAIRVRTRMTDIETKWREDRARLLVRVKAGAVPNEDSQEKYKLSLAEINVVRADAGLPELDRPYRVNAFAGMMAINAETERLQGEFSNVYFLPLLYKSKSRQNNPVFFPISSP